MITQRKRHVSMVMVRCIQISKLIRDSHNSRSTMSLYLDMVQILSVPMTSDSQNLTRTIQKQTTFAAIKLDAGTMRISIPTEGRYRGDERLALVNETSRQRVAGHDPVRSDANAHSMSLLIAYTPIRVLLTRVLSLFSADCQCEIHLCQHSCGCSPC